MKFVFFPVLILHGKESQKEILFKKEYYLDLNNSHFPVLFFSGNKVERFT